MLGSRHGRTRAAPLRSGPAKRRSAATAGHGLSAASAGAIRGKAEPWRRPLAGLGGRWPIVLRPCRLQSSPDDRRRLTESATELHHGSGTGGTSCPAVETPSRIRVVSL
jgi:hypothetical protein